MKEPSDAKLVRELTDSIRAVSPEIRRRFALAADVDPEAPAVELARVLADPTFARGAVRTLDAPARTLLRVLPHLLQPAPVTTLDGIAEVLTHTHVPACAQLCAAGIAAADDQRPPHLRTLGPLRSRLAALAHESLPTLDEPPSLTDETYLDHLASFRVGLALAAVEHARPRSTRTGELHKGDETALADLLSPSFDDDLKPAELLRLMVRQRTLEPVDGRFRVRWEALETWDDPAARMVVEAFMPWRHDPGPLLVLARLLTEDRWHALPTLAELLAIAVLRRAFAAGARADLARYLAMLEQLPGVHRRERDGVRLLRLSTAARRAFGMETEPRAPTNQPLLVQPNLQIVAQLGTSAPVIAQLGRFAKLLNTGHAAVFALDESLVRRAAAEGAGGLEALTFLEKHSARGVPSNVARALTDWGRSRGAAKLVTGTVLLAPIEPAELDAIAPNTDARRLAPNVYLVPTEAARMLANALRKAGFACEESGDARSESWAEEPAPWRSRAEQIANDARKQYTFQRSTSLPDSR